MQSENKIKVGVTIPKANYEHYEKWLKSSSEIEIIQLKENIDDVHNCDGIVFSGGVDVHPKFYKNVNTTYPGHPSSFQEERDEFEIDVFKLAQKNNLPVLAICRGFQLINCILGGNMKQDLGELNIIHNKENGADKKHDVTILTNFLFDIVGEKNVAVNSTHHQAIGDLSAELVTNAKSADGTIEGFEWLDKNNKSFLLGVQWHPEKMDDDIVSKNILNTFIKTIKENKQ